MRHSGLGLAHGQHMRGTRHLGSWLMFSDLSGQIAAAVHSPIITAAAVAVPRDAAGSIRTTLRRKVAEKWKYGKLAGLASIVALVEGHDLPAAVFHLHVSDRAKWAEYFSLGREFAATAERRTGAKMAYLRPDMMLRMELLGLPCAHIVGRLLRAGYRPDAKAHTIEVEIVADTDLRTGDTEKQFRAALLQWPEITTVTRRLGLRPILRDARCETEQDEPLLMLPDYLAGLYQHADPRAKLGKPLVTPAQASTAVWDLRSRARDHLYEESSDFTDEYPFAFDRTGEVSRRRDGSALK